MSKAKFSVSLEKPLVEAIETFQVNDHRSDRNSAVNALLYRNPEIQKILAAGVSHRKKKSARHINRKAA